MSTATLHPSVELHAFIEKLEAELESLRSKLPEAFRDDARTYLSGLKICGGGEAWTLRMEIRVVEDILIGLRDLSAKAEIDELDAEIERRKTAQQERKSEAERLKSAWMTDNVDASLQAYRAAAAEVSVEVDAIDALHKRQQVLISKLSESEA